MPGVFGTASGTAEDPTKVCFADCLNDGTVISTLGDSAICLCGTKKAACTNKAHTSCTAADSVCVAKLWWIKGLQKLSTGQSGRSVSFDKRKNYGRGSSHNGLRGRFIFIQFAFHLRHIRFFFFLTKKII
jgi:hypothetical protein